MSTAPRTLGHLALNYPAPADGPLAAKLLTLLGFTIDEPLLLPDGTNCYRVWVEKRDGRNDGIMYMAHLPEPLKALQAKIRERLDVGGENEDPEVAAFRAAEASDPELCFHVGVLYDSLDEVEQRIADVQRDPQSTPGWRPHRCSPTGSDIRTDIMAFRCSSSLICSLAARSASG